MQLVVLARYCIDPIGCLFSESTVFKQYFGIPWEGGMYLTVFVPNSASALVMDFICNGNFVIGEPYCFVLLLELVRNDIF